MRLNLHELEEFDKSIMPAMRKKQLAKMSKYLDNVKKKLEKMVKQWNC